MIGYDQKIQKTVGFALGGFSQTLDLNQVKIHALALMQIAESDDPSDNKEYPVSLEDFASFAGLSDKYTLKRNIITMAQTTMRNNPSFTVRGNKETIISAIFQQIRIPDDGFYVYVSYTPSFRKAVIEMKSKYDIIYPLRTVLKFRHKYTPFLYNYLLAKICEQRESLNKTNGRYIIEATIDDLCKTITFDAKTNFNARFKKFVIVPSCEDLNEHSELTIEGGLPTPIKDGKKFVGYRFSVLVNAPPDAPLFFSQEKIEASRSEIPNEEYIYRQMEDLGVGVNYIKSVAKDDNPRKAWQTLIFTRINCNDKSPSERGRYYNTAYTHNYALSKPLEHMFVQMYNSMPEYQDDVTYAIYKFYSDNIDSYRSLIIMPKDPPKLKKADIRQKISDLKEKLSM